MTPIGQIACKTVGVAGAGVALFNAIKVGKLMSKTQGELTTANYLENAYFNSRTIDNISYTDNNIRKKTFDFEAKLPIADIWGKIKGAVSGFFYSMGKSLPLIASSCLAIRGKGNWSVAGTIGVAGCLLYSILRNGFGLGKEHPMN